MSAQPPSSGRYELRYRADSIPPSLGRQTLCDTRAQTTVRGQKRVVLGPSLAICRRESERGDGPCVRTLTHQTLRPSHAPGAARTGSNRACVWRTFLIVNEFVFWKFYDARVSNDVRGRRRAREYATAGATRRTGPPSLPEGGEAGGKGVNPALLLPQQRPECWAQGGPCCSLFLSRY
jgi:hypothetical protein